MMSAAALVAISRNLGQQLASLAVVVDPRALERCFTIIEPRLTILPVDFGTPVPIRTVQLGRVSAGAVWLASLHDSNDL
jgi:hypothetical protein